MTFRLLPLVLLALACSAKDTVCMDRYARAADGNCYPIEVTGVIDSVEIGPMDVRTNETVSSEVVVDGEVVDPSLSNGEGSVHYQWLVDEAEVAGEESTLDGRSSFSKGQVVTLVVSLADGDSDSETSNTVIVANTSPPAPLVRIDPEQPFAKADDLTCVIEGIADPDGDPIEYTVEWSVDGEVWTAPEGSLWSAPDTGLPTTTPPEPDVVPATLTEGGQTWACSVWADDGEGPGEVGVGSTQIHVEYAGWDEGSVDLWSEADYIFEGEALADGAGASTAPLGDVDGDGRPDFLITSYFNNDSGEWSGKVYLVRAQDLSDGPGTYMLGDMPYRFTGEGGTDEAGHASAAAGDIDGDGLDDLLFCGYRNDDPVEDVGRVYLFLAASLGDPGERSSGEADVVFIGEATTNRLGHSVTSILDVTGDGRPEIVFGGYGHDEPAEDTGKLYIIPSENLAFDGEVTVGTDEIMLLGEAEGDIATHSTRSAGDVDGDGLGDIVLGARLNDTGGLDAGKGYLLLGASLGSPGSLGSLADADHAFYGVIEEGWLGYQASGAGDVDGDGLDDFFYGAHAVDGGRGHVYLYHGASIGPAISSAEEADIRFEGEELFDQAGRAIAEGGDVDADGLGDLLIGARNANDHSGYAYLVLGSSLSPGVFPLENADVRFEGEDRPDEAGYSVANIGDLNGDGLEDLLFGAWEMGLTIEESGPGHAYLMLTPGQ